jgi:hypothetical protein
MSGELFKMMTGVNVVHVPYRSQWKRVEVGEKHRNIGAFSRQSSWGVAIVSRSAEN